MGEILRHCLNCDFSREQQLIGPDNKIAIGQKIHTCQRFPPTPVLLPGPAGALNLTASFPIVNQGISCAEHKFPDGEGAESDDVPGELKVN
jgi:hypothetical protein